MDKAIIVADDSMIVRNIIENALKDEYIVLTAKTGREAIKHIINKKYEIEGMLLDLNMPDSDGFVVLNYYQNNNDKYMSFCINKIKCFFYLFID